MKPDPAPEKVVLIQTVEVSRPFNRKSWERLPDEPYVWFERFIVFRELASADRNVRSAYRVYCKNSERDRLKSSQIYLKKPVAAEGGIPSSWYQSADQYNWVNRAGEYHEHLDRVERETNENEIRKIAKETVHKQLATRRVISDKMIERLLNDLELLDKPLRASEIANWFRIAVQDQDKVNAILFPPEKQNQMAAYPGAMSGHLQASMMELMSRLPDGRPAEVVEMERKLRESEQAPAITQVAPQEVEVVVWEEP